MKILKKEKIAKMWCELNAWKIPRVLRVGDEEKRSFGKGAFEMLKLFMDNSDHEEAMKLWRKLN